MTATAVEASAHLLKDFYIMIAEMVVRKLIVVVVFVIVHVVVIAKSILRVIANYLIRQQQSNDYSNY
jgi:hypothetical protein